MPEFDPTRGATADQTVEQIDAIASNATREALLGALLIAVGIAVFLWVHPHYGDDVSLGGLDRLKSTCSRYGLPLLGLLVLVHGLNRRKVARAARARAERRPNTAS